MSARSDGYAPGFAEDALAMMSSRTARNRARFFLPALRRGMRVLDVGCGPGTITLGLAARVAPEGAVVGIDLEASQVDFAQREATRAGQRNVSFQVGSVYTLPFEDESFDGVLAYGLFEHLAHPREALAEMSRVLKAKGVVGICSSDWSGAVVEPRTTDVEAALACHFRLRRDAGGNPFAGRLLPQFIEAAGFSELVTTAEDEADMSYRELARYVARRVEAAFARTGDDVELEKGVSAAWRWAQDQDGLFTQRWVATTARKPLLRSDR